jgi:hypothetical protein
MKSILLLSLGLAILGQGTAMAGRPKRDTAKAAKFTQLFNQADKNGNGVLDQSEFAGSYGAHPRPVVTLYRFLEMSNFIKIGEARGILAIERGVYLDTFIRNNGGRALYPSRTDMFLLADLDEDGFLDPDEFASTRPVPAAKGSTMKALKKLDTDESGDLSPEEFGAEIVIDS